MTVELDEMDKKLLGLLAKNGRLSNIELAKQIPLTHSAISRRIARLENEGVIQGYNARIDPVALGYSIRAFVGVGRNPSLSVDTISKKLRAITGVEGCWIVTGEHDILLDVRAQDMPGLAGVLLNEIQKVEGVSATVSTFVLSEVR